MSAQPFTQPVSGTWLKPKDIPGHLLLVTAVHDVGMAYDDMAGAEKLKATFDYVDLDDPAQAEEFNVSDNHVGVASKLTQAQRTGGMVLGRITQAPSSKGNAAWILGPYTEGSDDQRATAWLATHPRKTVQQPAQQAPVPAAPAPAAPANPAITPEIAALLAQIQQTQQA